MTNGNVNPVAEQPIFAAELVPYRSLGRKGFRILLMITGTVCAVHAAFFMSTGAWPIGLFFGLDFLLLYGAFWLNYRSGRAREEVYVSRTDLAIRKFTPSGRMTEYWYNPFWTRFFVRRHDEIGIVSMQVAWPRETHGDRLVSQSRRPGELCQGLQGRAGDGQAADLTWAFFERSVISPSSACRHLLPAGGEKDHMRHRCGHPLSPFTGRGSG